MVKLGRRDDNGVERLPDMTFSLHAGEVLALAGVDGNGQSELADAIAGLREATDGGIDLAGQDITSCRSPRGWRPASPISPPTAPPPRWCRR